MITDIDRHKVCSLIPLGLSGHIIVNGTTIHFEAFEDDVLNLPFFVVSVDDRQIGLHAVVAYVAKSNVLHSSSGCRAILGIVAHFHVEQAALVYLLNADIVEEHILHIVVVTTVDGHTSLIIYLRLTLANNVDVFIHKPYNAIAYLNAIITSWNNDLTFPSNTSNQVIWFYL